MGSQAKMDGYSIQQEYFQGLENLRKMVGDIEVQLQQIKREFYCCDENNEESYEVYLKECNENLLYCNTKLRNKDIELEVIDSEVTLMALLTDTREIKDDVDHTTIQFLSQFWEHIKLCLESLQMLRQRFKEKILNKLQSSCSSHKFSSNSPTVATQYSEYVTNYDTTIRSLLHKSNQLTRGFQSRIPQELYSNTHFSQRVLICCDQKAFPILRLLPDLTEKMEVMIRLAHQWIDKDELYVRDVGNFIKDTRSQTMKKTEDLNAKKVEQTELSKTVDEAYSLCCSNKAILQQLESNLHELEQQEELCAKSKRSKTVEKKQKEGMVNFLAIGMTQTKKNYGLQMKRSRLMKQVRHLEQNLQELEAELSTIKQDMVTKSEEKTVMVQKVEESTSSYDNLKVGLEKMTVYVEKLQQEVNDLTDSLSQLEVIQASKVSPENMEDLYESSSEVRLAPSLRAKILRKKRRYLNGTNNYHKQ